MEFKEDGTYEFNVGGENHSSYWFLSDDEKTIHVYFDGYYIDFDIVSVNENTMKLRFDQIYYIDLNSDGNKEAIAYLNDFTLEKVLSSLQQQKRSYNQLFKIRNSIYTLNYCFKLINRQVHPHQKLIIPWISKFSYFF